MQDEIAFRPDRRTGLIFHSIIFLLLAAASLAVLWQAAEARIDPAYLLLAFAVVITGPILAYRFYALQSAAYTLMREGIRLRWGLRIEEIPMDHVLWIHPASDLTSPLPLPWLRLPGSLLGKRQIPGGGVVEYLAGGTRNLVFIATQSGGFAVSPSNPDRFIETYQRITELGSLSPVAPRSVYPSFLLYRLWADWPARFLLLGDFLLSLALLAWVSLSIPAQNQVHFSFYPNGSPGELVPSGQLILIPILNFFFLMIDLLAGLFFFRRDDSRFLAYLLWSASAVTTVLFLLAVFFILRVS